MIFTLFLSWRSFPETVNSNISYFGKESYSELQLITTSSLEENSFTSDRSNKGTEDIFKDFLINVHLLFFSFSIFFQLMI